MTTTTTYRVSGMTCDHCVRAVTDALSGVPGVTGVEVALDAGEATLSSEAPLDRAAVRAAVEDAGYELRA
jgi:copper chaperone